VTAQCTIAGAPSARTVRRWCRSFGTQAPAWLAAVQSTLAQQDPATPLLDPLGPGAGPADPPRALLAAAWHLLAPSGYRFYSLSRPPSNAIRDTIGNCARICCAGARIWAHLSSRGVRVDGEQFPDGDDQEGAAKCAVCFFFCL
jgi:hypothetical protein